jgi:hypothetical protein
MDAYVPLWQSLVWPVAVVALLVAFRRQLRSIMLAVEQRVQSGSDVQISAGPVSLKLAELQGLPRVSAASHGETLPDDTDPGGRSPGREIAARVGVGLPGPDAPDAVRDWYAYRAARKASQHDLHLAHVITPAGRATQAYDVYVYAVPGREGNLDQVIKAQFYLGPHWGNRIFEVSPQDGRVGLSTSAYGPTLCICQLVFTDGSTAILERFLDFEMGQFLTPSGRPTR